MTQTIDDRKVPLEIHLGIVKQLELAEDRVFQLEKQVADEKQKQRTIHTMYEGLLDSHRKDAQELVRIIDIINSKLSKFENKQSIGERIKQWWRSFFKKSYK